jgi:hypothetical protein
VVIFASSIRVDSRSFAVDIPCPVAVRNPRKGLADVGNYVRGEGISHPAPGVQDVLFRQT